MPCDQIRYVSMKIDVKNVEEFKEAMKNAGLQVWSISTDVIAVRGTIGDHLIEGTQINTKTGEMQVRVGSEANAAKLANTYAQHVLKKGMAKFGWVQKGKTDMQQDGGLKFIVGRKN